MTPSETAMISSRCSRAVARSSLAMMGRVWRAVVQLAQAFRTALLMASTWAASPTQEAAMKAAPEGAGEIGVGEVDPLAGRDDSGVDDPRPDARPLLALDPELDQAAVDQHPLAGLQVAEELRVVD